MTWRGALVCWALAAALVALYVAAPEPRRAPSPTFERIASPDAPDEPPAPPAYELSRERIAAVEVERDGQVVRWVPSGAGWSIERPQGVAIPQGILDAFVTQVVDGGAGERLEDVPVAETGLDAPVLRVRVELVDGGRLTLSLGARTPTATALYGRIEETGTLFVAGLSFLTYADLLLGALR